MKYPATVRKKMEQVKTDINKEFDITLRTSDIADIVSKYFGVLRRLMGRGTHNQMSTFIHRIKFPSIGYISFNDGVLRRSLERNIKKEVDIELSYECYAFIRYNGWEFLRWNQDLGYVYVHAESGSFYELKRDDIKGTLDAHIYFSEIVNTPYVWHNIKVNVAGDFKLAVPITSKGYQVYDVKANLLKEYDTLEEAAMGESCSEGVLFWAVMHNVKHYPNRMTLFRNQYWVLKDTMYKPHMFSNKEPKLTHNYLIDILDAVSGEVLYKEFGTPSDVARHIKSLNKYTSVRTGAILRVIDKNKQMYGHKFKRSISTNNQAQTGIS